MCKYQGTYCRSDCNMETQMVNDQYNSWGKLIGIIDSTVDRVRSKNPFRYRAYCWDEVNYYNEVSFLGNKA